MKKCPKVSLTCTICGKQRTVYYRKDQREKCPSCARKILEYWKEQETYLIGDVRNGKVIGQKYSRPYKFMQCADCGKRQWVSMNQLRGKTEWVCKNCQYKRLYKLGHLTGLVGYNKMKTHPGKEHPGWKGGRYKNGNGYIMVYIPISHPFFSMCAHKTKFRGYLGEHRLVMAQKLGRPLLKTEVVHHLNGIRIDNSLSNLAIVSKNNHSTDTLRKLLQKRIRELETKVHDENIKDVPSLL